MQLFKNCHLLGSVSTHRYRNAIFKALTKSGSRGQWDAGGKCLRGIHTPDTHNVYGIETGNAQLSKCIAKIPIVNCRVSLTPLQRRRSKINKRNPALICATVSSYWYCSCCFVSSLCCVLRRVRNAHLAFSEFLLTTAS